jgi:hypothetical protein
MVLFLMVRLYCRPVIVRVGKCEDSVRVAGRCGYPFVLARAGERILGFGGNDRASLHNLKGTAQKSSELRKTLGS